MGAGSQSVMFRKEIVRGIDHDPEFQWRGETVTRIENLSDIAFAIALGMLVSGSGVPETFEELTRFLYSFIPVAAGFSVLFGIWRQHFTFFRRYGINDGTILTINTVLIFVIMYMAYPLRFAFDSLFAFILMQFGERSLMQDLGIVSISQSGVIIGYFSIAYATTHFLLALMYRHAEKKRDELELNEVESIATKRDIFILKFLGFQALIVAVLAYFTKLNGFAGILFFFSFVPYFLAERVHKTPASTNKENVSSD